MNNSLSRNISITFTSYLLIAVLGLLRTSILTKGLGLEQFGIFLIIISFVSIFFLFFGLRVGDILYRVYSNESLLIKFKSENLFCLSFLLAILQGFIIFSIGSISFPFLIDIFYEENESLIKYIDLYKFVLILLPLESFYTPILRLKNKYGLILKPQVFSVFVSVVALSIIYFFYDLNVYNALSIYLVATALQMIIPSFFVFRLFLNSFNLTSFKKDFANIGLLISQVKKTFFDTTFSNYLKIFFNPGDLFLLGILSSPSAVGIYGLAKTISSPISSLGALLQTVYTPEVTRLKSKNNFKQIVNLVKYNFIIFLSSILIGSLLMIFFGQSIIEIFSKSEFFESASVSIVLIIAFGGTYLFGNIIYPYAITIDKIHLQNLSLFISILISIIFLMNFYIDAHLFAYLQLLPAIMAILIMHLPLLKNLYSRINEID